MASRELSDALDVLACEIGVRPAGAPGIDRIARSVAGVERAGTGTLVVRFDGTAASEVEAFVAAEQRCCSTLSWALETRDGALFLTVGASPQQLDVLEQLFALR